MRYFDHGLVLLVAVGATTGCGSLLGVDFESGHPISEDAGVSNDAATATRQDAKHADSRPASNDAKDSGHLPDRGDVGLVDANDSGPPGETCEIAGTVFGNGSARPGNACQACDPAMSTSSWTNATDGTACGSAGTGGLCRAGTCVTGCLIGGVYSEVDAPNPANPCETCQPATTMSAWSALPDGTTCGNGQVCGAGLCGTQCDIDGSVELSGASNPANACQLCQPGVSTAVWTSVADGASCGPGEICGTGTCGIQCDIGAVIEPSGAANPANACQTCQPTVTAAAWSAVANGTGCGNGQICVAGACGTQCDIGGAIYGSGAVNPSNPCESCQPGTSTTGWIALANGTGCGNGQICGNEVCGLQCDIGGVIYASGSTNPASSCQTCQPGTSSTTWISLASGASCGNAQICSGGVCGTQCDIGGVIFASGAVNPANACQSCQPGTSTTAWVALASGTTCGAGGVCIAATCTSGCYIAGAFHAAGSTNVANSCQICQPGTSTTLWTSLNGASCGAGEVCNQATCGSGCYIGGTVYLPGAANANDLCQSCQPGVSTTAWTTAASGPTYCAQTATCVNLGTDPLNCGSCGHSCGGETCVGGICSTPPVCTLTNNAACTPGQVTPCCAGGDSCASVEITFGTWQTNSTFENLCCLGAGQPCNTNPLLPPNGTCCGYMACNGTTCACKPAGHHCVNNGDCCDADCTAEHVCGQTCVATAVECELGDLCCTTGLACPASNVCP